MKRKITRSTLDELAKEIPVLSESMQAMLVGGSGTFTEEQYNSMLISGTWQGGFVEDLGYVGVGGTCVGERRIVRSFKNLNWNYHFVEGVGIRGTSYVKGYVAIESGLLTVSISDADYVAISGASVTGYAELIVDGNVVSRKKIEKSHDYIYQQGQRPLGFSDFDILHVTGNVQVRVSIGYSYDTGIGFMGSYYESIVYSQKR